jgi:hypothetical protein
LPQGLQERDLFHREADEFHPKISNTQLNIIHGKLSKSYNDHEPHKLGETFLTSLSGNNIPFFRGANNNLSCSNLLPRKLMITSQLRNGNVVSGQPLQKSINIHFSLLKNNNLTLPKFPTISCTSDLMGAT